MTATSSRTVVLGNQAVHRTKFSELFAKLDCTCEVYPSLTEWQRQQANAGSLQELGENNQANTQHSADAQSRGGDDQAGSEVVGSLNQRLPVCILVAEPTAELVASDMLPRLAASYPLASVIVYCDETTLEAAITAMRQGAANVLLSSYSDDQLAGAIAEAVKEGQEAVVKNAAALQLNDRLATLTQAEQQVLKSILTGMANKQIAQALQIGLRTVELRRSKVMKKMQAKSLAELVRLVCIAEGVGEASL